MDERRVVFVNRYFHPDHSATSQMVTDLAFHLASRGWSVAVITSRQRYDDPRAALASHEHVSGVAVRRVWTTTFGRTSLVGRTADYLTFYASAFFALARSVKKGTVVVAMTDPPLISVVAALAVAMRGGFLVNWLHDLFPEVPEAVGMHIPLPLRRLRDWSLRNASINVALSEAMGRRIEAHGANVVVRHNWADPQLQPIAAESNPLRREWNLDAAFVAGYSGNLGRVHEFETIRAAMEELRDDPRVRFLVVGSGKGLERLQRAAGSNVVFKPYQPRERLSESLSAADVHLVSLRPEVEGLSVPSKFYGALAVGRPVVFIGDAEGEIARLVAQNECGFAVPLGNSGALAASIRRLSDDLTLAAEMGRRARALYDRQFSATIALAQWEEILMVYVSS